MHSTMTFRIRLSPISKKYEQIEAFAKAHGVAFFPAGHGIAHQVMVRVPTVRKAEYCILTPRQAEGLFV